MQSDFWSLREEDAAEYERRLTGRFQEKNKKRKTLSAAAQHLIPVEKRARKKYPRKPGKRGDVVRLLSQFSQAHREAEEHSGLAEGGVVSEELAALFRNPFKVILAYWVLLLLFCFAADPVHLRAGPCMIHKSKCVVSLAKTSTSSSCKCSTTLKTCS